MQIDPIYPPYLVDFSTITAGDVYGVVFFFYSALFFIGKNQPNSKAIGALLIAAVSCVFLDDLIRWLIVEALGGNSPEVLARITMIPIAFIVARSLAGRKLAVWFTLIMTVFMTFYFLIS